MLEITLKVKEYFQLLTAWMPAYFSDFLNAVFLTCVCAAFLKVITSFVRVIGRSFL